MKCSILKIRFSILVACCLLLVATSVEAAVLYLSPQSQTVYQGESFLVEVRTDTEEEDINAIEGHLNFPQDKLEIIDIGKGGSILNLWPKEPFYSNQTGEISFIGGIPGGFQGQGGLLSIIFRVNPRVTPRESASITFKDDSKILLNDGKGTPTQLTLVEGSYEVTEKPEGMPVITSKSHPDQGKWYKESTLYLYWKLEKEAEYSWILSYDPLTEPDEIPDKPKPKEELTWMGAIEYTGLEDGVYYFHLRQKLPDKAWSKKITFRAMIDTMPPEDFEPKIAKDPTVFDGKYFLSFITQDKISGVDHYEIVEELKRGVLQPFITKLRKKEHRIPKEWKIAESPYLLEDQSLQSKILVKAIDKAGNERIAEIIPSYKVTWEDVLFLVILVLIVVGVVWRIIKSRNGRKIKRKTDARSKREIDANYG